MWINNLKNNNFRNYINEEIHLNKNVKLSQIIPYFPKMEHFVKYGDRCMTSCGVDCKYCHNCAHQMEQALEVNFG